MVESMVRLATWMPFAPAGRMITYFTRVDLSTPTVRRNTEKSGAAYVAVQTEQLGILERDTPEAPAGPAVQLLSVDGAMVPLVGGEWTEVKTLALGTVKVRLGKDGQLEVEAEDLSYFSRLADADTFGRLATVETHRRGTEKAGVVCAVVDGAEWEQKFIDLHSPEAVRILDWGHASEYVTKAGQAVFGVGTAELSEWLGVQLYELRHGEPKHMLRALGALRKELAEQVARGEPKGEALAVVTNSLHYLGKRRAQIRYAEFAAQGYPIGSGAVESANKLVVEARLKGAGMHWARVHVDPMVALRTIACSDRWEEAWPQISLRLRQQKGERAEARRTQRKESQALLVGSEACETTEAEPVLPSPRTTAATAARTAAASPTVEGASGPQRPAPNHPWRHMPIGKAAFSGPRSVASAES
ncbi:MAG: hypothetical protein ACUVX8_19225 [Candidatus Zipacnadales bacterium]